MKAKGSIAKALSVLLTLSQIASVFHLELLWQYRTGQYSEISISEPVGAEVSGVYVSGAVASPGFYPLTAGGDVGALVQAAGAVTDADLSALKLYVPCSEAAPDVQKIDINRAEAWLLEALPGIVEVKAQAIIAYREQHGPFRDISEITEVENIGLANYQQIKDLITVSE